MTSVTVAQIPLQAYKLTYSHLMSHTTSPVLQTALLTFQEFPWLQEQACLILKVIQLGMHQLGVWVVCNNLSQVLLHNTCIIRDSAATMCMTHPCALQLHHSVCGNQMNVISAWTKNTEMDLNIWQCALRFLDPAMFYSIMQFYTYIHISVFSVIIITP